MVSPFPFGRELTGTELVDRDYEVEASAVELLLDESADVPHSVQLLAHTCFRLLAARNESDTDSRLNERTVEQAVQLPLRSEDAQYSTLLSQLTANQKRALHAIAHSDGTGLTSAGTARHYGLPVSTLRRGVEAIVSRGIARRVYQRAETPRVVFEDPFFGRWVREEVVW